MRTPAHHPLVTIVVVTALLMIGAPVVAAEAENQAPEPELSLITATPEEGFQLAIALARKGVTETQPDVDVLHALRPGYAHEAESLIAASQVIAIHFQTVAAANDYWRE